MATLVEKYSKRLTVCESIYGEAHEGAKMPEYKKVMIARVLENEKNYLNEAFAASQATQGGAAGLNLGDYKKFCLNLTSVALPNLIGPELVITQPMASLTGYITYLQYQLGTGAFNGRVTADAFKMGVMDDARMSYTAKAVVEPFIAAASQTTFNLAFVTGVDTVADIKAVTVDGVAVEESNIAYANGVVTLSSTALTGGELVKIAYEYNNVIIPQETLPTLKATLKNLVLTAKARRIAVYYSQISAFQAKTDYGFDLADQIAEQAVGELQYEIDSAIVKMLVDGAEADTELTWSKTLPHGVSKAQHYEGFTEILEMGRAKMYKRTQKFSPNYMICDAAIIPVLSFIPAFKASTVAVPNGPYMAGTINNIKVYVSPMITDGSFVLGVKGNDLQSAAGVYAPYMAVVPTQLLGMADGSMQQGFSTMDDMRLLSTYEGSIADGTAVDAEDGEHSYLLIKGRVTA